MQASLANKKSPAAHAAELTEVPRTARVGMPLAPLPRRCRMGFLIYIILPSLTVS